MKEILSLDEIPVPSEWRAANGDDYELTVVGKDPILGDVICEHDGRQFRLDWFKLQYRYYLKGQ